MTETLIKTVKTCPLREVSRRSLHGGSFRSHSREYPQRLTLTVTAMSNQPPRPTLHSSQGRGTDYRTPKFKVTIPFLKVDANASYLLRPGTWASSRTVPAPGQFPHPRPPPPPAAASLPAPAPGSSRTHPLHHLRRQVCLHPPQRLLPSPPLPSLLPLVTPPPALSPTPPAPFGSPPPPRNSPPSPLQVPPHHLPQAAPQSAPTSPTGPVPEKKSKPSIFFLIIDFLVFGGAVAAAVLLFLKP